MDNVVMALILVSLVLLVVVVGLLTALVFKLYKQGSPSTNSAEPATPENAKIANIDKSEFHPAILERMKEIEKLKPKKSDLFCPNHPDEPGEVVCAICDKLFCPSCIKPFKTMHLCKEHLPLLMRYDWEEVITIKTSTHDPEKGVKLYDVKKQMFEHNQIPTYVETHYKINIDQDYIETYLVMYAMKENLERVKALVDGLKTH